MAELTFEKNKAYMQKLHNRVRLCGGLVILCIVLMILSYLIPFIAFDNIAGAFSVQPLILLEIVGLIASVILGYKYSTEFKALYKETIVRDALNEEFENVTYVPGKGFSSDQVKSFGLSRMGNRFHSEDYIAATYKGIAFNTSDVTIRYHSGSGKNSHTTTYFEGRMFEFQYGKHIQGCVQILPDKFAYKPALPGASGKLQMESVSFNNDYDVKAINPEEAFYILTPAMMENLQRLNAHYNGFMVSIIGSMIYVGIPSHGNNAFDVASSTKKLDYESERRKVHEDARAIIDIIEYLSIPTIEETGGVNLEMYRTSEEVISRQGLGRSIF